MEKFALEIVAFLCLVALASYVSAAPNEVTSTAADRAQVTIVIYSENFGLVREVRRANLPRGAFFMRFVDVAEKLDPASVRIAALTGPGSLSVIEQSYRYDLLSPQKLLEKFLGKQVTLVRISKADGKEERIQARLLSINQGAVWEMGGQIAINIPYDGIVFPEAPQNLMSRPTLVWLLSSERPGQQQLEVSYLTDGLDWRADYVLSLSEDERTATLDGWVTINNQSGASFENANLKLVAGQVRRLRSEAEPLYNRRFLQGEQLAVAAAKAPAQPQFQEQAFSEYHLYDLQRKTTLENNQMQQINFVRADGISLKRNYVLEGQRGLFWARSGEQKQRVALVLEFDNSKDNRLGMPLPAGTFKVYRSDSKGAADRSQLFIGEDRIGHTAEDERIKINIGHAFDIVAERKQMDYQRIADNVHESEYEITLRNHKGQDVVVKVVEDFGGDWQLLNSTHQPRKLEAFRAEFQVPVASGGQSKLRYRVRVKF